MIWILNLGAHGRLLGEGDIGVEPEGREGACPAVSGGRTFQAEGETNTEASKQECALLFRTK